MEAENRGRQWRLTIEAEVEVENGGCKKLFVAHKVATETTYIDHKW